MFDIIWGFLSGPGGVIVVGFSLVSALFYVVRWAAFPKDIQKNVSRTEIGAYISNGKLSGKIDDYSSYHPVDAAKLQNAGDAQGATVRHWWRCERIELMSDKQIWMRRNKGVPPPKIKMAFV